MILGSGKEQHSSSTPYHSISFQMEKKQEQKRIKKIIKTTSFRSNFKRIIDLENKIRTYIVAIIFPGLAPLAVNLNHTCFLSFPAIKAMSSYTCGHLDLEHCIIVIAFALFDHDLISVLDFFPCPL